MGIDQLLDRLDAVRPRSGGRWSARCPAHSDQTPSLSIAEGQRGILLHCFTGCTLEAICSALAISPRDLFYDQEADPSTIHESQRRRAVDRRRREAVAQADSLTADVLREAEAFIESAHGIEVGGWTDAQLDRALNDLANAYQILDGERNYEHV